MILILASKVAALEILFLENLGGKRWSVLYPARGMKVGDNMKLPLEVEATLGAPNISILT